MCKGNNCGPICNVCEDELGTLFTYMRLMLDRKCRCMAAELWNCQLPIFPPKILWLLSSSLNIWLKFLRIKQVDSDSQSCMHSKITWDILIRSFGSQSWFLSGPETQYFLKVSQMHLLCSWIETISILTMVFWPALQIFASVSSSVKWR